MSEPVELPPWPLFGMADDVRPALRELAALQRPFVLATLYNVVGGSPRPVGSQMAISHERLSGFMSGGCIEADIALHAADVADTGAPQRLIYGEGGPYPDIRLVCGGRVDILLERIAPDDAAVHRLLALDEARTPALWVSDGATRTCWAAGEPPPSSPPHLAEAAQALAANPDVRCIESESGVVGLRSDPVGRVIVVGGDPTAMAIASLSAQSGMQAWLVRPKGPEQPPPLAGVNYDRRSPELALSDIGLDRWTYVAVATHDVDSDESALSTALVSNAPYVGVLGARRRLPERRARLHTLGLTPEMIGRMRAPIGLDIGGKAPFEIAVAVLGEIIATRTRA